MKHCGQDATKLGASSLSMIAMMLHRAFRRPCKHQISGSLQMKLLNRRGPSVELAKLKRDTRYQSDAYHMWKYRLSTICWTLKK